MTHNTITTERRHLGLSALFLMALLALLPAACGPEREPAESPAAVQPAS
jgi:hypothetical protein